MATPRCSSGPSGWTGRVPTVSASTRAAIEAAVVDDEVLAALRRMIEAVRLFSAAQRPPDTRVEAAPGIVSERRWLPLDSVGLCVPSGRSALPSSLVMTAVPALVAGVRRIAVVTPSPSDAILVAARELGVAEVYAVGGAQAVAALAYGTETIAAVDAVIGPGSAYVTAAQAPRRKPRPDRPARRPSEVVAIADAGADTDRVAADLLAQAEHGEDSEAILFTDHAPMADAVAELVRGQQNIRVERVALARRGRRPRRRLRARAPRAPRRRPGRAPGAAPQRRIGVRGLLVGGRRLRGGSDPRAPDRRARAVDGRARARGVHEAFAGGHGDAGRGAPRRRGRRTARARGGAAEARGGCGVSAARTDARGLARPVGDGFAPYRWAASIDEVAERHGIPRAAVLKFDQNTPPLPGIPQVPLAQSMAALHEYPDGTYRALREAAAAYVGVAAENVVVGAGADDLILLVARVFLGPGSTAAIDPPTYALYRIATTLTGAEVVGPDDDATVRWVCNPNNPTGETTSPEEIVELAHRAPETIVVVDEAYLEYGGTSCAPWVEKLSNLVVLRTLSKAFGFAALRVGYALAHPDTAALLDERRAPAPVAGPAAAIAAASLREPRLGDVETTVVERERVRIALLAAGYDCPPTATNFVFLRTEEPLGDRLEAKGIVVRAFPEGIRISVRRPSENDVLLRALGAELGPAPGRDATVLRTTTETALRLTLDLDGSGRTRVETGHRLSRPPPDAARLPRVVRPGARRRRRSRGGRAPHGRGRARCARHRALAGARHARGRCPLRLGDRADGRGARVGRSRPRSQGACRDRTGLLRRAGRGACRLARRACARAVRD